MPYNNNTHYVPRYGKNSSKKSYDGNSNGGRDNSNLLNNQSSSSYIGAAGKDYDSNTSSSNNSGSYYSRRDMYGNSGYRSRYESYTPKNNSSSSSSYYRGNSGGRGSTYYGSGSHQNSSHGNNSGTGSGGNNSNNGSDSSGGNRRWQGFDRLYDSYSKYQDGGSDKFISRTGSYNNAKKENTNSDSKDDRRKGSAISLSRYNSSTSPHDSWVSRSIGDENPGKERRYFDGNNNDHRSNGNEISRKSSIKGELSPMHRSDSRKSSYGDIPGSKFAKDGSRNTSKESSRRSSIIQHEAKNGLESPNPLKLENINTKTPTTSNLSTDLQTERNKPEVAKSTSTIASKASTNSDAPELSRVLKKKTSFTDYLKSAKAKTKDERDVSMDENPEAKQMTEVKNEEQNAENVQESNIDSKEINPVNEEKETNTDGDIKNEETKNNVPEIPESAKTKEMETTPVKEASSNEVKLANDSIEEDVDNDGETELRRKLSNTDSFADTSVLSPVNESDVDFNFEELAAIPESSKEETKGVSASGNDNTSEHDGNISETETVIDEDLPTLEEGKKIMRKGSNDSERHELKQEQATELKQEHDTEMKKEDNVDNHDDEKIDDTEVDVSKDTDKIDDNENESVTEVLETKVESQGVTEEANMEKTRSNTESESGKENKEQITATVPLISKPTKSKITPYKLKRDSSGRSLLQRACKKGNFEDVKSYIERGASANEKDFCGFTCLHEAALEGHTEIVEYLIQHGANVNAKADEAGDSETPLIDAAENKHLDTVKVLLKYDADPTIFNIDGFTALTKIYNEHDGEEGYDEIIEVLEEANAKCSNRVARESNSASDSPETGRPIIEDPNDAYFANLIKRKGIFKHAAENSKEATALYFVSGNNLKSKPDILILAARNGHAELVDIILGLNPTPFDIDTESSCGVTALLASAGRGHFDVVESLLSKGADPFKKRKQDGLNALEIAQHSPHFDAREISEITKYMEQKSGTTIVSNVTSRVASRIASRSTSRAPSVPITSEDEEENEAYDVTVKGEEEEADQKVEAPVTDQSAGDKIQTDEEEENKIQTQTNISDEHEPSAEEQETKETHKDDDHDDEGEKEEEQEVSEKIHSNEERKRKHVEIEDGSSDESHHLKRVKSEPKPKVLKKESSPRDDHPNEHSLDPNTKNHDLIQSTPSSPASHLSTTTAIHNLVSTKVHEEQRIRSVEETRLWQEKVEAKKKARREMFLKSEKEKEQKRKEEEEKRIEEEKRAAKEKEEEKLRLAKEAEEKSKALLERKVALRRSLTQDHYPVGLRHVKFDGAPTVASVERFLPLYVFVIDNKRYMTDLQVSLLTSTVVSKILEKIPEDNKRAATSVEKSKLWKLFFKFIGLDIRNPHNDVRKLKKDGQERFQNLLIHFIEEDALKLYLESFPIVAERITQNQIEVSLDILSGFEDVSADGLVVNGNEEIIIDSTKVKKFIPPHLGYRKDVLRTVTTLSQPLW